jgi:hypothetical protein
LLALLALFSRVLDASPVLAFLAGGIGLGNQE